MSTKKIVIASRGSLLALKQTEIVKNLLEKRFPDIDFSIKIIKTMGDKIRNIALAKIGRKGLFIKEIEESLLKNESDIAVHSMKDIPTEIPEGLTIVAITKREDCRDALISKSGLSLQQLPQQSVVGTSSLRRKAQLLGYRNDLRIEGLRGNLNTRIDKLFGKRKSAVAYDAIVVAAAGCARAGFEKYITQHIPFDIMLPAVGQGALGIEMKDERKDLKKIVGFLDDENSRFCVEAERSFLRQLGGGCQIPIGAYAEIDGDMLILRAKVLSPDGKDVISSQLSGNKNEAVTIGKDLAQRFLQLGAGEILKRVKS